MSQKFFDGISYLILFIFVIVVASAVLEYRVSAVPSVQGVVDRVVPEVEVDATETTEQLSAVYAQREAQVREQESRAQRIAIQTVRAADPTPVVSSLRNYTPKPMAFSYLSGGGSPRPINAETSAMLSRLGYSLENMWNAGVAFVLTGGSVPLNCNITGASYRGGLAVKPKAFYPNCPDGRNSVLDIYRTEGKCTVVFDWTKHMRGVSSSGNSTAILAHEIGHCLHFIYGQQQGVDAQFKQIRPELAAQSGSVIEEVLADDFMICRHGVDTNWGTYSYYARFGVTRPNVAQCAQLNSLFDKWFAV